MIAYEAFHEAAAGISINSRRRQHFQGEHFIDTHISNTSNLVHIFAGRFDIIPSVSKRLPSQL